MDGAPEQVFIKNIPYDIDDDALFKWCSTFGKITNCSLKRDRFGQSRGFAFVKFADTDGYNRILNEGPYTCSGRQLIVKAAAGDTQTIPNDYQANFSTESVSPSMPNSFANGTVDSMSRDDGCAVDQNSYDHHLATLHDELEANVECIQINNAHEIEVLKEQLEREKRLLNEAEESYKAAEQDWRKVKDENIRLRTSLVKNIMQTFNIRRRLAHEIKHQSNEYAQIEKQTRDFQSKMNDYKV